MIRFDLNSLFHHKRRKRDKMKDLKEVYGSAIGTFIAEIATLPICTIKTVYQNHSTFTIPQTIHHIYHSYGQRPSIRGFFQASSPAIISQIVSTSSKYSAYQYIKEYRGITDKSDFFNNSLNGIAGGLIGSVITHPFDLWKNFSQRNASYATHLKNARSKGIRYFIKDGLYQGYTGSIAKNVVLYASLFPLLDFYQSKTSHFWLASLGTTLSVSLLIQPFDYYKVVKMGTISNSQIHIRNISRGFSLLLARSIPHLWITMSITRIFTN